MRKFLLCFKRQTFSGIKKTIMIDKADHDKEESNLRKDASSLK